MKVCKLWLEQDLEIPQFKRLKFKTVNIPVQEVIRRGIHPEGLYSQHRNYDSCQINACLVELINQIDLKIPELAGQGLCDDISEYRNYYHIRNSLEDNLLRISDSIYFIDQLDYPTLLKIAKKRLVENWSHSTALDLAKWIYPDFNDLRSFLKSKSKNLKLSGYKDLNNYELNRVLSIDDFEGQDKTFISHGIPDRNFRRQPFIKRITTSDGYLSLTGRFDQFTVTMKGKEYGSDLTFCCKRTGESVLFMPDIGNQKKQRLMAKRFAKRWNNGRGQLCFSSTLDRLAKMLKKPDISISFDTTRYKDENMKLDPTVSIGGKRIERFAVGGYPTIQNNNETFRDILRNNGVSMTGKKMDLTEKMARLAAKLYETYQASIAKHFQGQNYIKIPQLVRNQETAFPLLPSLELSQLLLAMYILKHLRGNAILDPNHDNNTYTLTDLARALINKKVELGGAFVRTVKQRKGV